MLQIQRLPGNSVSAPDGEEIFLIQSILSADADADLVHALLLRDLECQLMVQPAAILSDNTPTNEVMRTFERTQADWLPVLDQNHHLKGYISRRRMYDMYRKTVHDLSQD